MHPGGSGDDLELWIDKRVIREGYGWAFPARDEVRIGIGSFDPHDHVKDPTVRLAGEVGLPPDGYQGNWIPHQLRPATEDGVFFVGDSAGHCLPLTAEGIRTAFYFGIACGRELRAVLERRRSREQALERYGAFSASHGWKYACMLRTQHADPEAPPARAGRDGADVRARRPRPLGVRALPAHRAAGVRAAGAAGRARAGRWRPEGVDASRGHRTGGSGRRGATAADVRSGQHSDAARAAAAPRAERLHRAERPPA